jgi:Fe-S cluster assembly protein SufB
MSQPNREVEQLVQREYEHGFVTDIESDTVPPGLNEDTIRFISAKKAEPDWLLAWRLEAFRTWQTMPTPTWAHVHHHPIDYQDISY